MLAVQRSHHRSTRHRPPTCWLCALVVARRHLSIGRYHQHSVDALDDTKSPLEFFKATYPNTGGFKREDDDWRAFLGRFGITGRLQTNKIEQLSEGQKSRLIFAMMCMKVKTSAREHACRRRRSRWLTVSFLMTHMLTTHR